MDNLNVAVVSDDEAYSKALCMGLIHVSRHIKVTSFTSRQFVVSWADYKGSGAFYDCFDIVLWAGDEVSESYGDNIVYLTDKPSLAQFDYAGRRFALYKFSPADSMAASVFDIYSHLTGHRATLIKRDDVKLYAFASYCGGVGCTSAARGVCQELSRFHGMKVLYLSLEDVESACDYISPPEGIKTQSELLYRLLGKSNTPCAESYFFKDSFGVSSMRPSEGRNPIRELNADEMQIFISSIMEWGIFDVIVADLSTCMQESALTVMESAQRICLIARSSDVTNRENSFMRQVCSSSGDAVRNKIMRMEAFAPGDGVDVQKINEPLEGQFGKYISKLTEKLINVLE